MAKASMTYVEAINVAIETMGADHAEAVERLEALKAQLAKRNAAGSKGLTKTQKQNVVLREKILEILAELEEPVGATRILSDPRLPDGMSVPKLGALLKPLIDDGKVVKTKDKSKHIVYALA
jgi:hypothetical protein